MDGDTSGSNCHILGRTSTPPMLWSSGQALDFSTLPHDVQSPSAAGERGFLVNPLPAHLTTFSSLLRDWQGLKPSDVPASFVDHRVARADRPVEQTGEMNRT
jgi:hypothetical protein